MTGSGGVTPKAEQGSTTSGWYFAASLSVTSGRHRMTTGGGKTTGAFRLRPPWTIPPGFAWVRDFAYLTDASQPDPTLTGGFHIKCPDIQSLPPTQLTDRQSTNEGIKVLFRSSLPSGSGPFGGQAVSKRKASSYEETLRPRGTTSCSCAPDWPMKSFIVNTRRCSRGSNEVSR